MQQLEHARTLPGDEASIASGPATEFRRKCIPLTTRSKSVKDAAHHHAVGNGWSPTDMLVAWAVRNAELHPFPDCVR
jgi:hypothetical protein